MGNSIVMKDFTKSDAGYRSFPLLDDVREILLEQKNRERENRRLFGEMLKPAKLYAIRVSVGSIERKRCNSDVSRLLKITKR